MKSILKTITAIFLLLIIILFALDFRESKNHMNYGITFSKPFAQFMGLDWKETYSAILDDLGAKQLRLMSYWTEVEPVQGEYSFDDLDWQISEAAKREAKIILALGQKQPRWPECHIPDWAKKLSDADRHSALIKTIAKVVARYKGNENIVAWQVENEPYFNFGECPPFDEKFFDREITTVRALDPRPIIVSDSGELGRWYASAKRADILGTTLYRIVWNKNIGYIYYPIPASFYTIKAELMKFLTPVKKIIIVELQGEAWGSKMPNEMTLEEQYKSMNPDKLRGIAEYAKATGFSEAYFWGAEWWYWLKKTKGEPGMWNEAKKIFSEAAN